MPILTNTLYDVAVYGTDVYDAPEAQVLSGLPNASNVTINATVAPPPTSTKTIENIKVFIKISTDITLQYLYVNTTNIVYGIWTTNQDVYDTALYDSSFYALPNSCFSEITASTFSISF